MWFKQFGTWANNPLYQAAEGRTHVERVRAAIAAGERQAWIVTGPKSGHPRVDGEKGGATLDGDVLRELTPSRHALGAKLNSPNGAIAIAKLGKRAI